MSKERRHLGEILYKKGYVSKENLIAAIKKGKQTNKRLGEVLLEMKLATEDQIYECLAKQFGYEFVNLDNVQIPPNVAKLVPEDIIKRHKIIPIEVNNGELKVVIKDPMDLDTLDLLRFRLNMEIRCCLASPTKIENFLNKSEADEPAKDDYRSSIDQTAAELAAMGHTIEAEVRRAQAAEDEMDDGPIVRLANLIIDEAVRMRASDIHIEPMADRVRIRYRIDGVCVERDNIPKNMQAPLLARIKIMSGMDIGERRLPQDGRIKRTVDGQDIDFRVSCLPGYHGESTVLRILRPESVNIGIQAIGFEPDDYERFIRIIRRPNGIFLVTGPTGSGKTTTLYSALQELNRPDKKIITAEDPVEYNISGINQCQVKTEIGLTFEAILRSMLRQAPNIILIGEIRDGVVADIAIQAALTGHLVFSTLHTNDAPSAITRLIDMGVKPFLVASSIQAIMAQRLVRVICKECKVVDTTPDPHYLRLLRITPEDIHKHPIYKGAGCARCQGTGYKGRIAIFEMLEMNNQLRELAFSRAPASELRKAALASGMRSLLEDGKIKVFKGITTPDEVSRVAQAEELVVDV
ncbi:MAG TPA: GspE/PulE family protein [Anaerohalosphaeraceae bacterium]|nr:Flp pilus assembly complex ATPase component TadA [Phycisphaerae bacterium]HOK96332.1 GspE/PulE family protein [Anaerohalosphaeraceae bacterium]HOM75862.1 GspE/PulE family protein [Anaerohalosphaeraceae bacterium]HPC63478.1 GspE/PulE family protein [Anaerohalosphaeraceae bacterium]HRS70471.1 GspE/PulE family protein [Anaerohalosphaeraceae bacterium]